MIAQRINIEGKRFVLLPETEYERMCQEAKEEVAKEDLPPLPGPDKHGRYPAIAYARASLARDLILQRRTFGLSQQRLAALAGVRQETLSRIESGKHTATVKTIDKIDRVFQQLQTRKRTAKRRF